MDKREQIARMAQTKEDEILLARVYERITSAAARNIPAATAFLSKREQMLAAELLRGQDFVFFGGPAMAEREVCCYVPEYLDEGWLTGDEGPIAAVRAVYFAGDTLTHRDFLGALMGCGIKRETVGDIYVSEGSCDFLVTREILPYLLQNFLSAGRTKLHVEQLPQHLRRLVEVPGGDGVGHLEHHRVQLGGGHGVDILPGHPVVGGVGTDFPDLGDQVVHQIAAQEDQVLGVLGADVVVHGLEAAGDPVGCECPRRSCGADDL